MKTVHQLLGVFLVSLGLIALSQESTPIGFVCLFWGVSLLPFVRRLAVKQGLRLRLSQQVAIVLSGVMLISCGVPNPKVAAEVPVAPSSTPEQLSNPAPAPTASASPTVVPSSQSQESALGASVTKTGIDFSYESPGRVEESDGKIVVTYYRTWGCGAESAVDGARQEWQASFDLASQQWSERDRELSVCYGDPLTEWDSFSDPVGPFTMRTAGDKTVIRADATETDGSIIIKDHLVVSYSE